MQARKGRLKRYYIANLREGAKIEDVFLVASRSIANTRTGAQFLKLRLCDKTGFIDAVKWDASEPEAAKVIENGYLFVQGSVRTYNGGLQITVESCRRCDEDVDPSDFIAASERDPAEMMRELRGALKSVRNPSLVKLIAAFLDDEAFVGRFAECPAAKSVHHAYVGGLLEHTLGVVKCCAALAEVYPAVDRDILLTAAALHDIGKVDEFDWSGAVRYSDAGHLIGHIAGGATMVAQAVSSIEGFDPLLGMAVQHAVLAHHGELEYGSPKRPKSLEAVMLHFADDMDAKAAIFAQAIRDAERNGDSGLFTKKHHFLERPLFRGLPRQEQAENTEDGEAAELFDADLFAADMNYDPFAND